MTQVTISKSLLKKAHMTADVKVQDAIESQVPDLFDGDGWLINVDDADVAATVRELSENISDPPPSVGAQNTRLIEPLLTRGYGDENGHGLYLHRRGGDVTWFAKPTKRNKAVCLVPVEAGSDAEAALRAMGYTQL